MQTMIWYAKISTRFFRQRNKFSRWVWACIRFLIRKIGSSFGVPEIIQNRAPFRTFFCKKCTTRQKKCTARQQLAMPAQYGTRPMNFARYTYQTGVHLVHFFQKSARKVHVGVGGAMMAQKHTFRAGSDPISTCRDPFRAKPMSVKIDRYFGNFASRNRVKFRTENDVGSKIVSRNSRNRVRFQNVFFSYFSGLQNRDPKISITVFARFAKRCSFETCVA